MNLRSLLTADLQSAPFGHSGTPPLSNNKRTRHTPDSIFKSLQSSVAKLSSTRMQPTSAFAIPGPAFSKAGDGTRTRNLLITNQLLYRLSYASRDNQKLRFNQRPFLTKNLQKLRHYYNIAARTPLYKQVRYGCQAISDPIHRQRKRYGKRKKPFTDAGLLKRNGERMKILGIRRFHPPIEEIFPFTISPLFNLRVIPTETKRRQHIQQRSQARQ